MFLTVHATAGAILGSQISNPAAAFFAGYISHFILDAIPHGDDHLFNGLSHKRWVVALAITAATDGLTALLWLLLLDFHLLLPLTLSVAAGAFGAVLPDLLSGVFHLTQSKLVEWNHRLNKQAHTLIVKTPWPMAQGFVLQAFFFAVLVTTILYV